MNKTSNPVMKDGLGILARLVVIAMLLSILSTLLQGCSTGEPLKELAVNIPLQEQPAVVQSVAWKVSF